MEASLLLSRLDAIGHSLENSGHALALIGLGSVGLELDRLDAYSDLDFFVIVEAGYKRNYLEDLRWLSDVNPIAYCFANTKDGYKLLFADGIFCEFAVFEPEELKAIPYAPGRIVWKKPHVPDTLNRPIAASPIPEERGQEWLVGEALTNLFVGLAREKRGEKLSAMRFIQGYAVDRVVDLANNIEPPQAVLKDSFASERRFEQRYPGIARQMPGFLLGYERNRESALAILGFLEQHFLVNMEMAARIRQLCIPSPAT